LCFIAIDKPSFLGAVLGDTVHRDTQRAVQAIIDTWGKRCSQMIMFGDVPDIKVNSIPFPVIKNDHAGSWKAFAQVVTQVIHSFVTQNIAGKQIIKTLLPGKSAKKCENGESIRNYNSFLQRVSIALAMQSAVLAMIDSV